MTCPSNRRQDRQSAPDLALAKSARTMQGIALSSWRRRLKRMKKEKLAHRVSVIAFGQKSSPRASRCQETPQVQWFGEARGLAIRLLDRSSHCGGQSACGSPLCTLDAARI